MISLVQKTITIHADPKKVWEALTESEFTKEYFFGCQVVSDWKEGGSIVYKVQETVHVNGTIIRIEPGIFLQYRFPSVTGNIYKVSFDLTSTNGDTSLTITQGEFDDEERYEETSKGWDYILHGLKQVVESQ